jgi:hypothetical protein
LDVDHLAPSPSLSTNKYQTLHADLQNYIKKRNIAHKWMESLIGRLQNTAVVIQMAIYFLNRLRGLEQPTFKPWYRYKLNGSILADLALWLDFLKQAHLGISLSLLTTRQLAHL